MSDPKRHHYVPVFYLREFSHRNEGDGRLVVTDLKTRKQWWSLPHKVGFGTEFYTVNSTFGPDPYVIERELARVESLIAPIYREVIRSHDFPTPQHLAVILRFVSLLAMRSPGIRRTIVQALTMQTRELFERLVSSEQSYEGAIQALREAGDDTVLPPYTELKGILPEATFHLSLDQSELMKTILPLDGFIDSLLKKRRWSLAVIEDPDLSFITSDTPLFVPAVYRPEPGKLLQFDLPYPELYVPLSRQVALIARDAEPAVITADQEGVAIVNNRVLMNARFLYSAEMNFKLYSTDKTIGDAKAMLRHRVGG